MIILAGDIGGTKTWLQIANYSEDISSGQITQKDNFSILFERRYASADYESFDAVLQVFFQETQSAGFSLPEQACIGVAGPVEKISAENVVANVTNLPWQLDAQKLSAQYGLHCFDLINDFQAIAFGLDLLEFDDTVLLQKGGMSNDMTTAPKIVIGAGTGLGQALLVWHGQTSDGYYGVIPSEGGHCDFAPGSDEQRELLAFLARKQLRVSVEDVLSGRGLINIYDYLAHKYPKNICTALNQKMQNGDAAAAVSEAAASDASSLAGQALDLFVEVYGGQAGNFALACMATGGVYIAGGIAAKIRKSFAGPTFLKAFCDKGSMQQLMEAIPVNLVLDPQVGLKGAALVASRL